MNVIGPYFQCGECGLFYRDKSWAEKCEEWCKKHKTCNLEIIKYAVDAPAEELNDGKRKTNE